MRAQAPSPAGHSCTPISWACSGPWSALVPCCWLWFSAGENSSAPLGGVRSLG